MLHGLNILASYTDHFKLNTATTELTGTSVFISSFFGTVMSEVITDKLSCPLRSGHGSDSKEKKKGASTGSAIGALTQRG